MEPSKDTENLTTEMGGDNNRINLVLIVIALVVAIVALIVACVGISLKGTTQISVPPSAGSASGSSNYEDKIWSIAIGHSQVGHVAYIDDETGTLRGFQVDFCNAVCEIANKNCRILYDVWLRCWDSEKGQVARGGVGLMSSWYDGCAGWYKTYDRQRTFAFSEASSVGDPPSLYAKPGSSGVSSWKDLTGKKIGLLDGWWTDEFCLKRNKDIFSSGVPLSTEQIEHYAEGDQLVDAVNNGDVDYAFVGSTTTVAVELQRVDGDPVIPCVIQGPSLMTPLVNQELVNWWNEATRKLLSSKRYKEICQDISEEHGGYPGVPPEEFCFQ